MWRGTFGMEASTEAKARNADENGSPEQMGTNLLQMEEWLLNDGEVLFSDFDWNVFPRILQWCEFRLRVILELRLEATRLELGREVHVTRANKQRLGVAFEILGDTVSKVDLMVREIGTILTTGASFGFTW